MLLPLCRSWGYRRGTHPCSCYMLKLEGGDLHEKLGKKTKTPQVHECCNRFFDCVSHVHIPYALCFSLCIVILI